MIDVRPPGWSRRWTLAIFTLLAAALCYAEPSFPPLTGRVVDNGNFLSGAAEAKIAQQLEAHENATGNQVVVATLPDLQGYTIEEYGYQLGRHWGIGQKGKDNGVLLIVARAERKVRIEVGYGLEGILTDAISSNIIHTVITPAFKKGQFERGIGGGVTAIIDALGGKYTLQKPTKTKKNRSAVWVLIFMAMIFWPLLGMFFPFGMGGSRFGHGVGRYGGYGGGFGGGGFGGGGFGGGGGGFGGGGASGGW